MEKKSFSINSIGYIHSPVKKREDAVKQADEGAPEAWIELFPEYAEGIDGIMAGDEVLILTWLHLSIRDVLKTHPRGNPANPVKGVFATRSPNRPNPVGLHRVYVLEVYENKIKIAAIEAIDGTPVIDIKAVLGNVNER
ncbi:MAG: tRNA (N6-threonylcarbamoyladenosine(37)-N6)-methyltransferase TrmO [Ignavibacteriaceae bacterium]